MPRKPIGRPGASSSTSPGSWVPGEWEKGFSDAYSVIFDGVDDYVATAGADGTLEDKTYSFWAKSSTSGTNTVFSHGDKDERAFTFNWSGNGNLMYMGFGVYAFWPSSSKQSDGAWHYYAVVVDASNAPLSLLYVDGILQSVGVTSGTTDSQDYDSLIIGGADDAKFSGSLDEFAVFDGHLTSAQITAIYALGQPSDLTPYNPEHWWRMGDGDTFPTLQNMAANNYPGTMTNMDAADIVADAPTRAWDVYSTSFDGVDDYVNVGIIDYSAFSGLTIACWAKVGDFSTASTLMSSWGDDTINNYAWLLFWGAFISNKFSFLVSDDGTLYSRLDNSTALNDDQWYHVAVTWADTGNATIYIDGVADGTSSSMKTSIFDNDFKTAIGCDFDQSGEGVLRPMEGSTDECAIWNSALSASDITAIYNSGKPADLSPYSPLSWWRMGDGDTFPILRDIVATDDNALYLPGIAANYASVPDAADLDGFTNFTLEAKGVTLPDWTPSAEVPFISKYRASGSQKSWLLALKADGKLLLVVGFDGSSVTQYVSTAATGVTDGATADIMVLRTGLDVRFYVNGVQLGTDVTCVATALHAGTANVYVGDDDGWTVAPLLGSISRARVWNSAVGSASNPTETPVLDMNFTLANKGATSFDATSGQRVTINQSGIDPAVIRGATDGFMTNMEASDIVADAP